MQKKYKNAIQLVFLLEVEEAEKFKYNLKRKTDYKNMTDFLQETIKKFNNQFEE